MPFLISLILLMPFSWSQSQRELDVYIQMMNLRPLPQVSPKREALYQLGLRLYYDKKLSGNENTSCHSCHALTGYSGDTLPLGVGEGAEGLGPQRHQAQGLILARHTPSLFNMGLPNIPFMFWDGRVSRHYKKGWLTPEPGLNGPEPVLKDIAETLDSLLAVQAIFPIANPAEMLGKDSKLTHVEAWDATMNRLFTGRMAASYKRFFQAAYPGVAEFNIGHVGNALAELERHHFLATNTLWDLYLRGRKDALTERMKKGAEVFYGKAKCVNCHSGEHLTSFGFQNIGVPQIGPGKSDGDDKGRYEFTKVPNHMYRFRIAPLRNVALTAPYMHSGAFTTMWEVIDHYIQPERSIRQFQWNPVNQRYRENLLLDISAQNREMRTRNLANNLPLRLNLTREDQVNLYCFLMVGLTDIKFQSDLINKGLVDEIDDCSPRITW